MERKIGDTFEFEGKKIEVKEASHGCHGCFLQEKCYVELTEIVGICGATERTDKKDVVFVEVQEQPQKLNLCEVLKYCPEGMEFWSPIIGAVSFSRIDDGRVFVKSAYGTEWDFNPDSTITFRFDERNKQTSPEPMIFPSREQRDWTKVKYEKKELPKTWEEFCETHEVQKGEAYIKDISTIYKAENTGDTRDMNADKNILPSEQACRQHLALMQLHQLRDVWREGWVPDWTEDNQRKYAICSIDGEFSTRIRYTNRHFLAFQDEKRADEIMDCFIDLIRKAGDLI